jgi:hypothetical protein
MTRRFNIVLVFAATLLLDGLLLPGMFGFRDGILVLVFLMALMLNWGVHAPVLWLGSGISLFLEFFWKLTPGSLMILFLSAALLYYFISSLFKIKRYAMALILSFGLGLVFWHNMIVTVVTAFAGFAMCFLLFDHLCSEKKSIKFL